VGFWLVASIATNIDVCATREKSTHRGYPLAVRVGMRHPPKGKKPGGRPGFSSQLMIAWRDSNPHFPLAKGALYPLSYTVTYETIVIIAHLAVQCFPSPVCTSRRLTRRGDPLPKK
jgi:hypothetical protein